MSNDAAEPETSGPPQPSAAALASSLRSHVRGSALLLAGKQSAVPLTFIAQVLTVRVLSQSAYGAFAYALTFVPPATTLIALGFGRAIARFVPVYQERQEHDKVRGAILLTVGCVLTLGLIVVLSVVALRGLLLERSGDHPLAYSLLAILIVLAPAQALDNLFSSLFAIFVGARAIFMRRHVLGPTLKLVVVLGLVVTGADVYFLAVG